MAISTTRPDASAPTVGAKGNSGDTAGPVKTPAPNNMGRTANTGYGNNQSSQASSLKPSERMAIQGGTLAQNEDAVLKTVIARGAGRDDSVENEQTRTMKDTTPGVPIHPAMAVRGPSSGSPGGTIPPRLGMNNSVAPIRKP